MTDPPRRAGTRIVVLMLAVSLVTGCGGSPSARRAPTATPISPCTSLLPNAGPIDLGESFPFPLTFPPGSVGTPGTVTTSGTGQFIIVTFQVCSPGTTASAAASFFEDQLPMLDHGWNSAPYFPDDGGLMRTCTVRCWYDARSVDNPLVAPPWYLVFDDFAAPGQSVVTYRGRYAQPPDFPTCASAFANSPTPNFHYYLFGYVPALPLPPLTFMAPDDAAHVHGYVLCSPGTGTSVTAFITRELPATGWKQTSGDPKCVYESECWTNAGNIISWSVGSSGASDWHIAWRS